MKVFWTVPDTISWYRHLFALYRYLFVVTCGTMRRLKTENRTKPYVWDTNLAERVRFFFSKSVRIPVSSIFTVATCETRFLLRSCRVVTASDCQCRSWKRSEFDPSILTPRAQCNQIGSRWSSVEYSTKIPLSLLKIYLYPQAPSAFSPASGSCGKSTVSSKWTRQINIQTESGRARWMPRKNGSDRGVKARALFATVGTRALSATICACPSPQKKARALFITVKARALSVMVRASALFVTVRARALFVTLRARAFTFCNDESARAFVRWKRARSL